MKRTLKHGTHLVELKREIPEMRISQAEKLTGGFLGISVHAQGAGVSNINIFFCKCTNDINCGDCDSTPTATPTSTKRRSVGVALGF